MNRTLASILPLFMAILACLFLSEVAYATVSFGGFGLW
jgi:hypothetical protein